MSLKSARRSGQLFPYRLYKDELTTYYYQALASDIPFTQYLAYYHVVEFFFQTVSKENALNEIKKLTTRPSFSPNSKVEIEHLYEILKKKIKEQRDDGVWNEKNGLLLCLKQFIPDLNELKIAIDAADRNAISYYKTNTVEFASESKIVDFDMDFEVVYNSIRDRVYSVRNSIVHSKEGEKAKYEPFRHDGLLVKEIALIKCIAEEVIINTSGFFDHKVDA